LLLGFCTWLVLVYYWLSSVRQQARAFRELVRVDDEARLT
jgi:hypothetical protein